MLWPGSTPGPPGCRIEHRRARRPRLRRALQLLGELGVPGVAVSSSALPLLRFPYPTYCSLLYDVLRIWVTLRITFLAMGAVFQRRLNILRVACGDSNSPRGFGRCILAYFSLPWRPLLARKMIFMALRNRRSSPIPSWRPLKFTRSRKKQGRNWTRARLTQQDSRNFNEEGTTWLIFPNARFQRTRSLPPPQSLA